MLSKLTFLFGMLLSGNGACLDAKVCPTTPICENPCFESTLASSGQRNSWVDTSCSYNLWGDISFIYWQLSQDNMEIGLALQSVTPIFLEGFYAAASVADSKYVNMDFDFLPGFKIGLGMSLMRDNWDWKLEYTRLHGENSKYSAGGAFGLSPSFADSGSMDLLIDTATLSYGPGKASWNIKFDFLDADLGRLLYSGTSFSFHPFFGIRGAWIRQKLHGSYWNSFDSTMATLNIASSLRSWGVGPRAGLDGHWLMGHGMRLYGNAEADLLYTRYHWNYESSAANFALIAVPVRFLTEEEGINAIRGHIDLELGLGWGSSFHKSKCHFDLSAGYGFQVFFNQNMFKFYFFTTDLPVSYAPIGNLYVQGMTIKAKLDF